MLQKYRHIIWDWNGTLINDAWLCVEIINEMLGRRNRPPITRELYLAQFGFPVSEFYERIEFDFSAEPYEVIAREYTDRYEQRCRECSLHDNAMDVLRHCLESGRSQSILSAYHQERLEEMLDFFEIRSLFTTVSGRDDYHAHGKIEQGTRLTAESGFGKDQTVLIGDTIHDYEVARQAGVDCILFAGGHYHQRRLQACGVPIVRSLEQLLEM
jgi:phosphoglycolate phosphatase